MTVTLPLVVATSGQQADALTLIVAERIRQAARWDRPHDWGWGDCSSAQVDPAVKVAVLLEEVGEVARAVLDLEPAERLRAELVQVAAVCVAWLEGL